MALKKTAIAVPAELLAEVDAEARRRGESRSAFITRVLQAAVRARRDREITRRLDALFADPALQDEARRTAHELDRFGTDWTDERW
jgi:hypothetical protein